MTPFAAVLLFAAMAGWILAKDARPRARRYLRFAAILFAALAAGAFVPWRAAVTPIVFALALPVLALAAAEAAGLGIAAWVAAPVLALACLGGVAAAMTGFVPLAFAPFGLAVAALAALALGGFARARGPAIRLGLAAAAFVASASSLFASGMTARAALFLFAAAGFFGAALALRSDAGVEQERPRRHGLAIRRPR